MLSVNQIYSGVVWKFFSLSLNCVNQFSVFPLYTNCYRSVRVSLSQILMVMSVLAKMSSAKLVFDFCVVLNFINCCYVVWEPIC